MNASAIIFIIYFVSSQATDRVSPYLSFPCFQWQSSSKGYILNFILREVWSKGECVRRMGNCKNIHR